MTVFSTQANENEAFARGRQLWWWCNLSLAGSGWLLWLRGMGVHNKRFIDVCGTCYGVLDRLGNTGAGELSTVLTTKNSDELILISWHGGVRPNASAWADRRAAGPKSPGPEGRRNEQREPLHIKPDGEPCPYKPEQPYNSEGSRCCRRRVLEWPCASISSLSALPFLLILAIRLKSRICREIPRSACHWELWNVFSYSELVC
jgi:hypothetical protein